MGRGFQHLDRRGFDTSLSVLDTEFSTVAPLPICICCTIQGIIPSTISNLASLTQLNMSYNVGVVGVLPPEVGCMASLTVLHLYCAGIHGESGDRPSSICGLDLIPS